MKMQGINRYEAYKDSGVEWLGKVPAHWQVSRVKNLGSVDISSQPNESCNETNKTHVISGPFFKS